MVFHIEGIDLLTELPSRLGVSDFTCVSNARPRPVASNL